MTDRDYSNEPVSIAEARADKAWDAAIWSPRDCLIETLRKLDSGKIKPSRILIAYREGEPDDPVTVYSCAGNDIIQFIGMLERVKHMLLEK